MLLNSGVLRSVEDRAAFVESFLAAASRDQAAAALCSANVPRPSASSLISLRRARHRPDPMSLEVVLPSNSHPVRRLGAWGEWRSGIKEEAAGRGTAAEPLTPSAEAYKTRTFKRKSSTTHV